MVTKVGRNEPCPCGSGLKYKRCHALKEDAPEVMSQRKARLLIWAPILFCLVVVVAALATSAGSKGRVWSEAHGHWHDVDEDGVELTDVARPLPQPTGPAPAGKVWSAEHGHWHDAGSPEGEGSSEGGAAAPAQPAPAAPVAPVPAVESAPAAAPTADSAPVSSDGAPATGEGN